jgi:hypothetical protein
MRVLSAYVDFALLVSKCSWQSKAHEGSAHDAQPLVVGSSLSSLTSDKHQSSTKIALRPFFLFPSSSLSFLFFLFTQGIDLSPLSGVFGRHDL